MNIDQVKAIREQLEDILSRAKWANGKVTVKVGRGTYDNSSVTFKVDFAEVAENGMTMSREANDFLRLVDYTGFKAEDLGKTVTINRETFKLIGAKWRTKRPIIMERASDKKIYIFPAEAVRRALGYPAREVPSGL